MSTSRYVFKIPTGPDSARFIDAEDPMSCYARYADDSFYDGTENAHWVETGTGAATRLALVAITTIKRGEPIRACYGWEYWFDPNLFTKALMTKAFRGYINYIKDDDDEAPKACGPSRPTPDCMAGSSSRPTSDHKRIRPDTY